MRRLLAVLMVCAMAPTLVCAQAGQTPAQVEAQRLTTYGFEPLSVIAAAKRTLRRVSYANPWGTSTFPGVTYEKLANGDISLTVIALGQVQLTTKVPQAEWDRLVALDPKISSPPDGPVTPAEAKVICDSNSIVIETSDAGVTHRREASHCHHDTQAMLYGYAVAQMALTHLPKCQSVAGPDREPSWQLEECYRK